MPTPIGDLYSLEFFLLIASAVIWFRIAQVEDASPWLWSAMSFVVYVMTWKGLGWTWIGCVFGQVLLALAITCWRAWKAIDEQRREEQNARK